MNRRLIFWCCVVASALGSPLMAQDAAEPPPKVILIRPAAEPSPPLRYRLIPERRDLIPGNAAIFYHRAIERMIAKFYEMQILALKKEPKPSETESFDALLVRWLELPLEQLPKDEVRRNLGYFNFEFNEMELGVLRESCDWEFSRRNPGYSLLIPDIQETRRLGRLIALRARLDIAEGRVEDAIRGIRTGLAFARNIDRANLFIPSIIAAANAHQLADDLEYLVQIPGCPNLYWALTDLPRPFIDSVRAAESEKLLLDQEFPKLRDAETEVWSLETAREFGDALEQFGRIFFQGWPRLQSGLAAPSIQDLRPHGTFLALIVRSYPEAKRALVAGGIPPERVEAMPMIQAVALQSYRTYLVQRDELFKWMLLPYWQARAGFAEAPGRIFKRGELGIPFGSSLLPAVEDMAAAAVRLDRRIAALRIIEGVRQYAAAHDGALPPDLAALSATPAPNDPATGRPFDYKVEGETATLFAPHLEGLEGSPKNAIHYELKAAR